ncbi:anti-sigma factor [Acuticoccus sp. M5D2P5]|uniref:anti-sigma factor n=1 Tax=Acuticoccus kalidii TaxID=2910977 RepID=UPI001F1DB878|nr:anti-sigma factor [Acuticoccus kalidii]MCF3935398.1 anti-sigma factor [Acuticoccus kalidii]
MMQEHDPDDDDMLAAEFALRMLTGDALETARRRAAEDTAFARRVADWEVRLSALGDDLPPVPPRPATKRAVLAAVSPVKARPAFWRRVRARQALGAAGIVALALLAVFVTDRASPPSGPLYAAEIVSDTGDFRVVAVVDKSSDEVILTRTRGAAPAGRILQVWAHGPDAPATSVGLWPDGNTVRLSLPPEIAAVDGVLTLGVSEEPVGGSPTGSPTGRVFGTVDIPGVRHPGA